MRSLQLLSLALLSATSSTAQTWESDMATDPSRRPLSASLMNITFADAGSNSCSNSSSRNTTSPNPPNTLAIAIRTIPQNRVCFDLGNTFSAPANTYSQRGLSCKDNSICGVNYTITSAVSDFSTGIQYSQIGYTQISNPFADPTSDEKVMGGRLELKVYNGANCKDQDGLQPREWDCLSRGEKCDVVPFAVKSFSVEMTAPKDVGVRNCSVARVSAGGRVEVGGLARVGVWVAVGLGVVMGLGGGL